MINPHIELGVNIDHVATVRQARGTTFPDPVQAALVAEQAGADLVTVHLREDRRHIQERDVTLLAQVIETRINLEMAASDDMIAVALRLRPADCCLVPERREELTTEGGLDIAGQLERIRVMSRRLAAAGIRVSLFIDPDPQQIEAACAAGAPVVELHTGAYAGATEPGTKRAELTRVVQAARQAAESGLIVHAGHGLNYHNVMPIAVIPEVSELNIGHAIVARAVFVGLGEAVREMKRLMREARFIGSR